MSYEVIKPAELLGAYLSNELSPEERTAVERLLADDPAAAEQLDELRELTALLKDGDREVSQSTIDALRRTVFQKIRDKQLKALVTVSITGDLTEQERADVKAYLTSHPSAEIAQKQALTVSILLKEGNRSADGALAEQLRAKLKSALPAAALAAPAIKTAAAKAPAQDAQAASPQTNRTSRPSLRVFVRPENPWKKRLIVSATSLAALLAIGVGVRAWWLSQHPNATVAHDGENKQPRNDTNINSHDETPVHTPEPNVVQNQTAPEHIVAPKNPHDVPQPDKPNENVVVKEQPSPVSPPKDIPTPPDKNVVGVPAIPNPKNPVDPRNSQPKDAVTTITPDKNKVAPNNIENAPPIPNVPPSNQKTVDNSIQPKSNGGAPILVPNQVVQNNQSINPGPAVPPPKDPTPQNDLHDTSANTPTAVPQENGTGTVGSVKNGNVQITSGGVVPSAKAKDTIAPNSKITTGDGVISIILPGNGRLYIKANSELTVNFGIQTSINLTSGEIYYNAGASKGSLTLTANKVQATKITEADIALSGGRLVVLNTGGAALKLGSANVPASDEFSAAADGSDTPRKDTTLAITDNGVWRAPVLLDGDTLKAQKNRSRR